MNPATADRRAFVPQDLDPADWDQLQPLYETLDRRALDGPEPIHRWLLDFAELTAVVSEFGSLKNIDRACHTDDPAIEKAFLHYVEQIAPKIKPWAFKLQKKLLDSEAFEALLAEDATSGQGRLAVLGREWLSEVEIYREANVPLQTQVTRKVSDYDALVGAMEVEFQGETHTLPQLARFLEATDRATRQEAWSFSVNRRLEDREKIDGIFDELVSLREKIATNADLANYQRYAFKAMGRFDYTPEDCRDFADAIEAGVVPLITKLDQRRQAELGVEVYRPWDTSVDAKGRPPLVPFGRDEIDPMLAKVRGVFEKIDPALAADFARLKPGKHLDLESRRGKRAGGFQAALAQSKQPFIFMNAAGVQRDVETLLHEGGHAFHWMWASAAEPLVFLQHGPIEFCEVASMTMELLGADHFGDFYDDPADAARAKRKHLEGTIRILPWIATIDQFQDWLYTHPGHDRAARTAAWREVLGRFSGGVVDYAGFEDAQAAMWHKQLHLFHHPFYYVEYGIAQLGALQLWQRYREDPQAALADYRKALTLGGSRPLPALFEAAGIEFRFDRATLDPLIAAVEDELEKLPA